jgi:photosystem II stability/assembly factor-like uncharacterized protein
MSHAEPTVSPPPSTGDDPLATVDPARTGARGNEAKYLIIITCVFTVLVTLEARTSAQVFYPVVSAGLGEELTCGTISHRDPNFVLVGTSTGVIFRSEDGGSTWQKIVVIQPREAFFGPERKGFWWQEYGLGLPGFSPHLQSWLRSRGLPTAGLNLQQLLVNKGDRLIGITWLEVDWNNENIVFVGTSDGLYRSQDKARTFTRVFQGVSKAEERQVVSVATDPQDSKKVLLGTAFGLFISQNGGWNFRKHINFYLFESLIREIWFDPENKNIIHLAMGGSAMASPDGGKNWITTHWDERPERADVISMSIGPENLRLIGTRDGIFASFQGGEMGTWRRRGIRFIGQTIMKVLATRQPSTWLVMTDEALWATQNYGVDWSKVFQFGGQESPRWLMTFKGNLNHLWFLSNKRIYRVGAPPLHRRIDLRMRKSKKVLEVPALYDFLTYVLRYHRVSFAEAQKYRDRGPWASLFPAVSANFAYSHSARPTEYHDYLYRAFPYQWYNVPNQTRYTLGIVLNWEIDWLVFTKRMLPHFGRVERNLAGIRQSLTDRISKLYPEYKQVARQLAMAPPANRLAREYLEIRLHEIAAYFDGISGGYWSRGGEAGAGGDGTESASDSKSKTGNATGKIGEAREAGRPKGDNNS